jgi:hypothetical protein
MAVYHHVPDGNHASSQPYPPMVVPFNPCGGATPATPLDPARRSMRLVRLMAVFTSHESLSDHTISGFSH